MAHRCGHCGGTEFWAGLDSDQCARCGGVTDSRGRAVPPDPKAHVPFEETGWKDGRAQAAREGG